MGREGEQGGRGQRENKKAREQERALLVSFKEFDHLNTFWAFSFLLLRTVFKVCWPVYWLAVSFCEVRILWLFI